MKVPYPSISDNLAVSAHMYICKKSDSPVYEFIKCQTLKPYMICNNTMKHFCDEVPDINRNPFQRTTRIDCDKLFSTDGVEYNVNLKTYTRGDVCVDLFSEILKELMADGYNLVRINETDLLSLNALITTI